MNRALSPREMDVLRGTAAGLTDAQIARRLHLAVPTVKGVQRETFRKLGAVARAPAVDLAWRAGILGIEP